MKTAIIGCGRISPNHFAANLANKLDLVAVCDVLPERMSENLAQFDLTHKVKQYVDYKQMLATECPELVAICTESGLHAQIALDCLNAGVNLIIEKPIALGLDDADAIIALAKQKGLVVSACHQNRFNKSIQKIREAVEQGRFGKMFHGAAHIRWNRGPQYYQQAPWRGTWEQDGGCLMNQCIHNIDLLRWMMGGEITEIVAMTDNVSHSYIEAEDLGLALVRFGSGAYGIIEGTTNIFPTNLEETLYLFGETGTVKAGGHSVNTIDAWSFADKIDNSQDVIDAFHENPPNVYGFGHTPLYADVVRAIQNGTEPYVTAQDGRDALEAVLAIYLSAATKQPVSLPLQGVKSTDFSGRFDKKELN